LLAEVDGPSVLLRRRAAKERLMPKLPAFAAAALVAALFTLPTTPGGAAEARPVTLAEVSATVGSASLPDAAKVLRQEVESALAAIDWSRARSRGKRLTLSAALVRLDSSRTDAHGVRTRCTVSATLRDERGALVATLEGRADAEDDVRATRRAERDALSVAVKGAVSRVPEALERVR
jgi:hypothetical protein